MGQAATTQSVPEIVAAWGITTARERPDILLAGSPERTEFRTVIEDAKGALYVLEKVPQPARGHKERICRTLARLQRQGLATVIPYRELAGRKEEYIYQDAADGCWQLAEFCEGVALDRKKYFREDWRGLTAADFLSGLRRASEAAPLPQTGELFSLAQYIDGFMRHFAHEGYNPAREIAPVTQFLEDNFFPNYGALASAFCHGDYHPVTIMWGCDRISGVNGWEFLGIKPEMYDAATMIGCVGIDDPAGIVSPLVCSFLARLRKHQVFSPLSWQHLFSMVLGVRFAFLAEWQRLRNPDMASFEIQYMNYLLKSRRAIEERWEAAIQ